MACQPGNKKSLLKEWIWWKFITFVVTFMFEEQYIIIVLHQSYATSNCLFSIFTQPHQSSVTFCEPQADTVTGNDVDNHLMLRTVVSPAG